MQCEWKSEFGACYDVPKEISQHPRLEDCSWHNDAAPSFVVKDNPWVRLWVDHPVAEQREVDGGFRFSLVLEHGGLDSMEFVNAADRAQAERQFKEWDKDRTEPEETFNLFETDDLKEMLAKIEEFHATPTPEALAKKFCEMVRRDLTPEQLVEVNRKNALEEEFCASHEFIDSNQSLIDAWGALTLADMEAGSDTFAELHDKAWNLAKKAGFSL